MMTHLLSRTHEPSNLASMPTFFRKRSREILARNPLEHLNICASFSTSSRAFRKRRTDIHKLLESDEECNQRSATAICLQGHKQRLYEATSAWHRNVKRKMKKIPPRVPERETGTHLVHDEEESFWSGSLAVPCRQILHIEVSDTSIFSSAPTQRWREKGCHCV